MNNENGQSSLIFQRGQLSNGIKRELPVYKLTYFNSRGYAEVSRLILHYKRIPFDDIRINIDEWSYHKNSKFYQLFYIKL